MSKLIPKHWEGNKLLDESSKYAILLTYYPFISDYPLTGHSELRITGLKNDRYKPYYINKGGKHKDYNLVTNNCSDATRCALEKVFNKKINPFLFTTPGDVQDFALEELNGIPKIKGDSIYDLAEHKYKLDLHPKLTKRLNKGVSTVYIPLSNELRSILKQYIEQGKKNKEFKKGGLLKVSNLTPKVRSHEDGYKINNVDSILNSYPEVSLNEEPWARNYFLNNLNVAGMAIGGELNGILGNRRVIVNPYNEYMSDLVKRKGLLTNERLRHYMDEINFNLPNITELQINKYKNTPYKNDTVNIGRTEAARYLVNDKSNSSTEEQIRYVNSLFNKLLP